MPLIGLDADALRRRDRDRPSSQSSGRRRDDWREAWRARRDHWAGRHRLSLSPAQAVPPRLPPSASFARLPFELLLAYQQHREDSELGRVFRIANGLHDHIDALVVIGSSMDCLPAQLLAQACCDPFHNEQSRAARGSKPRLYFLTDPIDNDEAQSLIDRLAAGGYGDVDAERRWGLIWSQGSTATPRDPGWMLFQKLFALLRRQGDWRRRPGRPALVTRVGPGDRLQPFFQRSLGVEQSLWTPGNLIGSPLNAFAPLGLLVGAFLGLDVVRYLVGALAVTQNCLTAEPDDNLAIQYAAANALDAFGAGAMVDRPRRWTAVPSRTLLPIAEWMSCVDAWWQDGDQSDALGGILLAGGTQPFSRWQRRSGGAAPSPRGPMKPGVRAIVNQLRVESIRTDPLMLNRLPEDRHRAAGFAGTESAAAGSGRRSPGGAETAVSLADLANEEHERWQRTVDDAGFERNVLRLPAVDTAWLGQLLQMQLLAWSVASCDGLADRGGGASDRGGGASAGNRV